MNPPTAVSVLLAALLGCASAPRLSPLPPPRVPAGRMIDVRGKTITTAILAAARASLLEMRDGEVLEVITSPFPAIEPDVRTWCRMTGQTVREIEKTSAYERYSIEKAPWRSQERRVAIVVSDPGLEELLSPLGLAVSAALVGADVHVYFQGPGVHVLERGFRPKLKGPLRSTFSGFARDALEKAGHSPPQEKLKLLLSLGAHLYACGPSLEHFGVDPRSLAFEEVLIAQYPTFLEPMMGADVALLLQ